MAEKEDASDLESVSPCEYKALKECLDRNQGKKEKCEKEWQEFQNACTNNKRLAAQGKLAVPSSS